MKSSLKYPAVNVYVKMASVSMACFIGMWSTIGLGEEAIGIKEKAKKIMRHGGVDCGTYEHNVCMSLGSFGNNRYITVSWMEGGAPVTQVMKNPNSSHCICVN